MRNHVTLNERHYASFPTGYEDYFDKIRGEAASKRRSYIPMLRDQLNSMFQLARKSDLPTYINELHHAGSNAFKRSEIPKADIEHHTSDMDTVKNVSVHIVFGFAPYYYASLSMQTL